MSANYLKVYTRRQKPLRSKNLARIDKFFEQGFVNMDNRYKKILSRLFDHKVKVLLLVVLIFILSMMQFSNLGISLAPSMSEDSLTISLELPSGTPLDETEHDTIQLVKLFEEIGGYDNMIVTIGESGMFSSSTYSNKSSVEVVLPDAQDQTVTVNEMKNILRQHFNDFPGATLEFTSRGPGMGNDNPVDILVKSDDLDAAVAFADELKEMMADKLPRHLLSRLPIWMKVCLSWK